MDTSQLFIICIDCQALYFYVLKGNDAFFHVPGKRKLYPWHSSTKCPTCERRGFLHETSFKKYYDMYEDAKKECYRARADKETALIALYQAQEQGKKLQEQLDALGPIGSEQAAGILKIRYEELQADYKKLIEAYQTREGEHQEEIKALSLRIQNLEREVEVYKEHYKGYMAGMKRANLCQCGCGKKLKQPITGRKRKFATKACQSRYHRIQTKLKKNLKAIKRRTKRDERTSSLEQ